MTFAIAIAGCAGRMGRALIRAAAARGDFRIAGGSERAGSESIGADVGMQAGVGALGVPVMSDVLAASANATLWIDFTTPAATLSALDALAPGVRGAIVGTTGFTGADEAKLNAVARKLALVRSGNFSLGVNLLAALVRQAAQKLGTDWDIEIAETHHRRKVDAPSGTALLLGEAAAQGRGSKLEALRLHPHDGINSERPEGKIGFASLRGGGIIGEHEVMFASEREIVTLKHEALDRSLFADGALAAALWAADKKPGLYSMRDVLGL